MLNLAPQHDDIGIHRPRDPQASGYYRCVHDHFEQLEMLWQDRLRYYGYYSNKSRGMRKKAGTDDQVPALVESNLSCTAFRRNWARLITITHTLNYRPSIIGPGKKAVNGPELIAGPYSKSALKIGQLEAHHKARPVCSNAKLQYV
jgi:hypothetical protein